MEGELTEAVVNKTHIEILNLARTLSERHFQKTLSTYVGSRARQAKVRHMGEAYRTLGESWGQAHCRMARKCRLCELLLIHY